MLVIDDISQSYIEFLQNNVPELINDRCLIGINISPLVRVVITYNIERSDYDCTKLLDNTQLKLNAKIIEIL